MAEPTFPIEVDRKHRQIDGDQKTDELVMTEKRNKSLAPVPSLDPGKKRSVKPLGPIRYREGT